MVQLGGYYFFGLFDTGISFQDFSLLQSFKMINHKHNAADPFLISKAITNLLPYL